MLQAFFNNSLDQTIASFLLSHRTEFGIEVFSFITSFANYRTVEFVAITVAVLLLFNKKINSLILFVITIETSNYLTFYLKAFFHRPRPFGGVMHGLDFSFPSGHSSVAVALYGFLIYLVYILPKFKYKNYLYSVLLLIIIGIGFSRMYLGVHYLSDVIFGYLVGFTGLALCIFVLEPWWLKNKKIIIKYIYGKR